MTVETEQLSQEMATDPMFFEARTGAESHSSSWGKFVVKGLDTLVVEDRNYSARHGGYTDRAGRVQPGAIFTVWQATGDKRGTDDCDFYICRAEPSQPVMTVSGGHGRGGAFVRGRFSVLATGAGKTKAPRLLSWWDAAPERTAAYALHLASEIGRRGVMQPAPFVGAEEAPAPNVRVASRIVTRLGDLPCSRQNCSQPAVIALAEMEIAEDGSGEATGAWRLSLHCAEHAAEFSEFAGRF